MVLFSPLVEGSDTCWQGGQAYYNCQGYIKCGYSCAGSAETETCSVQGCPSSCGPCDQCANAYPGMYADPSSGKCVSETTTTPSPGPAILQPVLHLLGYSNLTAAIGTLLATGLRSFGDHLKDWAWKGLQKVAGEAWFPGGSTFAMAQTSYIYNNFFEMAANQGYDKGCRGSLAAILAATLRLFLWHLLQPAMFGLSYLIYYHQLNGWEQVFFWSVAIREIFYVLLVLVTLRCAPVLFLWRHMDADNSYEDGATGGLSNNFMYVCAPEKFLLGHLFKRSSIKLPSLVVPIMYLFDACGTVAFYMLCKTRGNEVLQWLALFISYGFAPISLLTVTIDGICCGRTSQFLQAWSQTREVEMQSFS